MGSGLLGGGGVDGCASISGILEGLYTRHRIALEPWLGLLRHPVRPWSHGVVVTAKTPSNLSLTTPKPPGPQPRAPRALRPDHPALHRLSLPPSNPDLEASTAPLESHKGLASVRHCLAMATTSSSQVWGPSSDEKRHLALWRGAGYIDPPSSKTPGKPVRKGQCIPCKRSSATPIPSLSWIRI